MMLLLFPFVANAQKEIKIHHADSLLDMTSQTMRDVDILQTIELSSKALALSTEANYSRGMVRSLYVIGQALFYNQNYDEALDYLSRAEKVKDYKKYPLYMTQIYKVRGQIYFYLQMKEQALRDFSQALYMAKFIEEDHFRGYLTSQIYESFCVVYSYETDKETRYYYLQKNKELLESMEDESFLFPNMINMYSLLGEYYVLDKQLDSAFYNLDKALSLIDKYDFKYVSATLRHLGDAFVLKEDYRQALDNYLKAISSASELGLKSELPLLHQNAAQVYNYLNMPDSAAYHDGRKVFYENEMLVQKVKSTDNALQILINQERETSRSKNRKVLVISILLIIVFGFIISRNLWKRKHKTIMEEVEVETKQLKKQLNEAFDDVLDLAKNNDPAFLTRFQEVYPDFWQSLIVKHTNLTTADLHLCALTYLNISTAEIAKYTYVETRTVQTRRSRLRKKIDLDSNVDLYYYLKSIEL